MTADLAALRRVLARTAVRIRVQRAVESLPWALSGTTLVAAGERLLAPGQLRWSVAAGLASLLALAAALSRPVRRTAVADALDRAAGLAGRLRAALEFEAVGERTSFMEAALRDAAAQAHRASPAAAAPLRRPRASGLLIAAFALFALLPRMVPPASSLPRAQPLVASTHEAGVRLANDDVAAFESAAAALARRPLTDGAKDALDHYRSLLADIAAGSVSREQALERALTIERALAAEVVLSAAERRAIRTLSAELARLRTASARTSRAPNESQASEQLKAVAHALREKGLSSDERARLAQVLARARARLEQTAGPQSEDEQLLKRKQRARGEAQAEQSVLEKKRRELEALQRERAQTEPLRRELQRLQRELDRAQQALNSGQPERAADALDRGSQSLTQQADAEALSRELAQLREQLQRQQQQQQTAEGREREQTRPGQGSEPNSSGEAANQDVAQRRERFRLRALGERQDDAGTRTLALGQGERNDARPNGSEGGEGGERAQGASGQSALQLGAAGESSAELALETTQRTERLGAAGGDEHDERTEDSPGRRRGSYEDRDLAGARSAGPTRSQVIGGAARGGFATAKYQQVYGDYQAHAEELLERDDVPPGYRFYVRRYFQLVRPRAAEETQ